MGLLAGVVFGIAQIAGAALADASPVLPIRMAASVVMGPAALTTSALEAAVAAGVVTHLVLGSLFGLFFGIANMRSGAHVRTDPGRQGVYGIFFGILLWLVNFQLIARAAYPWFLDTPQLLQAVMHALFYGLPLGVTYAATEKRVPAVALPRPVA